MSDQQVYAALEIADHEIRLLVGEFHNTRLNILKVEKVSCSGITGVEITDQASVVGSLIKAVNNASANIGARIERVLLLIPSAGLQRYTRRIQVQVSERITLTDVQAAIKEALKTELPEHLELINLVVTKFIVNGITSRRMPLNEPCTSMGVDIDLLCADRHLAYSYAEAAEKAGLEILDVSIDSFAVAKEASLLEKSIEQFTILIRAERQTTTLTLFAKGKLVSSEILMSGSDALIGEISDKVDLPLEISERLLHFNCRLDMETYPTTPIYLWSSEGKTHTLTEKELADIIQTPLQSWLDQIKKCCDPILQAGQAQIVLSGEAAEIFGLDAMIKKTVGCECELYVPETFGVRNSSLAAVVGMFYVLKDQQLYRKNYRSGVNMEQFNNMVANKSKEPSSEDTLTRKLKGILFETKAK